MSEIKKSYDRIAMNAAQKSALKTTLYKNFPQYADDDKGRAEVIIMNKENNISVNKAEH